MNELGSWLWLLAGFCLLSIEIFSGRGIALSFGLGAIFSGSIAIMGQSGTVPAISTEAQVGIWMLLSLILLALFKKRFKYA